MRLANQIYDEVKRHFQELVFKTIIQRNVKLSEAPSHGIPAILYDGGKILYRQSDIEKLLEENYHAALV